MNIKLERFKQTKEYNFCKLLDGVFQCYTLEDVFRETKVYSETQIQCKYTIKLRTVGNFHQKYLVKFVEDSNKGALLLKNVPNYEGILIHIGNSKKDTAGCILMKVFS